MEKMIALIQIMLYVEKDVEVVIQPPRSQTQLGLFHKAYSVALEWSKAVNLKVKPV